MQIIDTLQDLELLAEEWNGSNLSYGVAHGLEDYPTKIGRDLDVIVKKDQITAILHISVNFLEKLGYSITVPPNPWGAEWLFAFKGDKSIEIDFIPNLAWGPVQLVNDPEPNNKIGPFIVDMWATFAKSVLMKILGNSIPKNPTIFLETNIVYYHLEHLVGSETAKYFIRELQSFKQENINDLGRELRKKITTYSILHYPHRAILRIVPWILTEIRPHFNRTAPIIALVGPDGCGKTTVTKKIMNLLPPIFLGQEVRHWRPGLLPTPGELLRKQPKGVDENGLLIPGKEPGNLHWIRLTYYFLDFFFGSLIKDNFDSSTLRVILYDRCALDMWVDPYRYALQSRAGLCVFLACIQRPDKIIFLHDDPIKIHARKPELSIEEIRDQNAKWDELAKEGKIDSIIDVGTGVDASANEIREIILKTFIEKDLRKF